jgi:hypothetical protein
VLPFATFRHDALSARLRTVLPRLQTKYDALQSSEGYAKWVVQYEAIKIKQDAAAAELRTLYPDIVSKLVDLLSRIEIIDRDVTRVRSAKPFDAKEANGDGRWLLETELTARGLDHWGTYDLKILTDMKVPNWDEPKKLSWPVPRPPIDWGSTVPKFPHRGADWWQAKQAENTRGRIEDEARAEALHEEVRNDPKLWRRG